MSRNMGVGFLRFIVTVCVLLVFTPAARAAGPVDVPARFSAIELDAAATPVAAARKNLAIQIPGSQAETPGVLELNATGKGPNFNWTVYTVRNLATADRKLVLFIDQQRFAGSGLMALKPFGLRPLGIVFSEGQETLEREPVQSGDAVTFEVKPNATVTFAIEGESTMRDVTLYSQDAFASRESFLAFLRGASIAIAAFLALGTLALYGIRTHVAFLAAGFFALTAMFFMALDAGYLGNLATRMAARGYQPNLMRAVSEGFLLIGLAVLLPAFSSFRQRGLLLRTLMALGMLGSISTVAYAFVQPLQATQAARLGFAGLTVLAFVIGYIVRRSGEGPLRRGILLWVALVLWTFFAAITTVTEKPDMSLHIGLLLGLAGVLAVMAFSLVKFAFQQGYLAKPFLTDASRRSLALAGGQHYVWDWVPRLNKIDIGHELARNLGYAVKEWEKSPAESFLSILHPNDQAPYRAILANTSAAPGSFQEVELRLREAEGQYRWFALRVRALPGQTGVASRFIGTLTDITRNKIVEDKLVSDAVRDPVTGLPSRAIIADRLVRELEKDMPPPMRVLYVGLERFKNLNEGLGQEIGDQLLMVAGQRISEALPPADSVARLSGSQFAVLHFDAMEGRNIEKFAADIRNRLSKAVQLGEREVFLTPSIGVSRSSAEGYTAEALLEQAANALHIAQKQSRQGIRIHDPADLDHREEQVNLENDLRRAISNAEIEVHYQPIVTLATGELAGLEALARWRHPKEGLLQPGRFITMAEQAGLMPEIGNIVIAEVTRQMGIWMRTLIRHRSFYAAVNLSADHLSDSGFVDRLRSFMARESLPPDSIKIEITESMAMRHPDRASQLIQRLQSHGIGVACDDFGTGFSSLASLRDLPFDTLKIDKSFLQSDAMDGRGGVILDMVVALAHSLGMTVVGEGIEDEVQGRRLLALGCDLGQGYFYGEPMAAREAQELLQVLPRVETPAETLEKDMADAEAESVDAEPAVERTPEPGAAPRAPRIRQTDPEEIFETEEAHDERPEFHVAKSRLRRRKAARRNRR